MSGSSQYLIDALDSGLAQNGETLRLIRPAKGATPAVQVSVLAMIRGYAPSDLVAGSGINQQDQKLILSPTAITAAGWPGASLSPVPIQGDRVATMRGVLTIQAAVGIYVQDMLVRIEAQVRGT